LKEYHVIPKKRRIPKPPGTHPLLRLPSATFGHVLMASRRNPKKSIPDMIETVRRIHEPNRKTPGLLFILLKDRWASVVWP
jgi:hypothetical protein